MKLLIFTVTNFLILNLFSQSLQMPRDFKELPDISWQFSAHKPFYSSPVVKGNMVYAGNLDSTLYAIDLTSGHEKWKFQTKGEIRSNVCTDAQKVYLNGGDGAIYALDANSGKHIWKFRTNGEHKYDFADYFHSSPVLRDGKLYFGSGDSSFYAVNAQNGALIWSFKTGGIVHTTPALENNTVFFGSFDGYVYALHAENGELIWKFKTVGHRFFPKGEVQGSPAIFKNLVFIGARDYNFYAIDQNKGFCHWNKAFTKGWGLASTVYDSILYIGCADERKLLSVNPENGKENWNKDMEFLIFGNNSFSDSILYVGTTIGKLHGISLRTGQKIWSFQTENYRNYRLKYFKNDDSYRDDIYSIIRSNEQFLEVECELGGIFSTPVISDNLLLFSSTNGIIYCIKNKPE